MGDRYILKLTCPECGFHDDSVYYAPTCGFTEWVCKKCDRITNLGKETGISREDASNMDEIKELIKEHIINTSLVATDYSQMELRVAAHESQDEAMMEIYHSGGDIHMETACAMFNLSPDEVDNYAHRRPAKTVNFGVIYDISPKGLLESFFHEDITNFTFGDCANFINSWKNKYYGYFEWAEETKAYARRNGYVRDMFGRLRHVPEVYSTDEWVREAGLRKAVNTPIQSGAQGIIKEAMVQLTPYYKVFRENDYIAHPLIQVHDELLWEIEDGIIDILVPEFEYIMQTVVELLVPIVVETKVGYNWKDMKPWKGENNN